MEKIAYLGLPNCYRLANQTVELIVTTDVGPRILHYSYTGQESLLGEAKEMIVQTELGEWRAWGGHRLWAAPEALPRTYAPDSHPLAFEFSGENSIRLTPPIETATGLQKEMTVTLVESGTEIRITHRLTNRGLWAIEIAAWALTIMNGRDGGEVILPQEPYISWAERLLPARPMVLWHYTDLSDPRWKIGPKFIRLRADANMSDPQKLGIANKQGWAAFHRKDTLFVKSVPYLPDATYPDYGCNTETYTAGEFIELETLSPLCRLEPGAGIEHIERWHLFRDIILCGDDMELDRALKPVFEKRPQNAM